MLYVFKFESTDDVVFLKGLAKGNFYRGNIFDILINL